MFVYNTQAIKLQLT